MKLIWLLLLIAVLVSAVCLPIVYVHYKTKNDPSKEDFFFGVSFGGNTTSEAKLLIGKVKDYTNLFLINSVNIYTNETALNEVSEYAVKAGLKFMVFFDLITRRRTFTFRYPWHQTWLDTAKERYGDKFLGVYLFDEPGGKQIDKSLIFANASDYSDAANRFATAISSRMEMQYLNNISIPVFTSDYALYWFDYLAGYDTIFVELGWNHSTAQHIALGRGAANIQGKEWGTIIVWTYYEPPYLASGPQILQDMLAAYQARAKYVIVFNYPKYPDTNPYGILTEEHFTAMRQFWAYIHRFPRSAFGKVAGQLAFVLPKDYGWGMRDGHDNIWGIYPPDDLTPLIGEKIAALLNRYGSKLDIIYDDPQFNYTEKYTKIYFWNSTID
jgi:hypothetical protein